VGQTWDAEPRHNLPTRISSFVGREREIAEIARLLGSTRLLTLSGTPGVGKTRLAVEVAESLLGRVPDGVWLIELAPLDDPGLVPKAVAAALGVREQPGQPLRETLLDALRPRRTLLLLDNCEHVVDACAGLADRLLQSCADLTILATSREPLGIAGETSWRVPSLSLPEIVPEPGSGAAHDLAAGRSLDAFEGAYEAVRLFVERARAARPGFALTAGNAPAVIRVCQRLDGIPLALELAAARVTALSVEQIADRLDDRFRLLTGGSRTALPHQRTLRAAVDWSHDLLAPEERVLLRRLAVFAGGWTLEAAEAVCGGWDGDDRDERGAADGLDVADVLDVLQRLVNKSLVVVDMKAADARSDGSLRYRMLAMLQQYARERLAERGERDRARQQHAAYFLALAERAEPELRGPHESEWSARLEAEHDNLRAALRRVISDGQAEPALRLGSALWRFWTVRGHMVEGLDWLEQALALGTVREGASAEFLRARAGALNGAGNLAAARGEHARSLPFHEESLALRRRLADRAGEAASLLNLGTAARNLGIRPLADAQFTASLDLFRELGQIANEATAWLNLGRLRHDEGDSERATACYQEALARFQEAGSDRGVAIILKHLGDLARERGALDTAARLYGEAVALRRGQGDLWITGLSLIGLARVAALRHDHAQAMMLAARSVRALHEAGASRDTADALVIVAAAICATGQPSLGVQLLGAVDQAYPVRSALEDEQASFERAVAAGQAVLDEPSFAAAWAEGQRLALDQAVALALATVPPEPALDQETAQSSPADASLAALALGARTAAPQPAASTESSASLTSSEGSGPAAGPGLDALTRREREVAALIAGGLTNREIAERLVISEMTADSHVSHILRKLRFRSRAQVATWAVAHRLSPPEPA
jgi:non-specific serine/threonine protein kinase